MNEISHWRVTIRQAADRLRRHWSAERVLRWSSRAARCFFIAAPVLFLGSVALGIYQDKEALRLMPNESHYDVPSGEETALILCSIFSLMLAAGCSVIAGIARHLIPPRFQ
jgi:4-hydroxybenzoate polyprenyltransferase